MRGRFPQGIRRMPDRNRCAEKRFARRGARQRILELFFEKAFYQSHIFQYRRQCPFMLKAPFLAPSVHASGRPSRIKAEPANILLYVD
jgi:hypothetical protein